MKHLQELSKLARVTDGALWVDGELLLLFVREIAEEVSAYAIADAIPELIHRH